MFNMVTSLGYVFALRTLTQSELATLRDAILRTRSLPDQHAVICAIGAAVVPYMEFAIDPQVLAGARQHLPSLPADDRLAWFFVAANYADLGQMVKALVALSAEAETLAA